MNSDYSFIAERAGGRREYCKAPEKFINSYLEVDHFIPISAGGTNDRENLVLACRSCNSYKSFHQIGLLAAGTPIRLFNPRVDDWDEHFSRDRTSAKLIGLTENGEGTINRLRMNSEPQLRARKNWLRPHWDQD